MCEVSVIIPIFNMKTYVPGLINNLACQTFSDFELIIIDDGSTDGTYECLVSCTDILKNVVLVQNNHGGPSHARNTGLDYASGKYILFIDADDRVDNNFIEKMYSSMISNECDMVECMVEKRGAPSISEDGIITSYEAIKLFYSYGSARFMGTIYNKMFSRSLISSQRFDEKIQIGEDADFILNYLIKAEKVFRLKDVLYHHSKNETGIIQSKKFPSYLTAQNASVKMLMTILQEEPSLESLALRDVIDVTKRIINLFPHKEKDIVKNLLLELNKSGYFFVEELLENGSYLNKYCNFSVTRALCNAHIHLGEKQSTQQDYIDLQDFLSRNHFDAKDNNKKNNLVQLVQEGVLGFAYDNLQAPCVSKLNSIILTKNITTDDVEKSDGIFIDSWRNVSKEKLDIIRTCLESKYLYFHISSSRYDDAKEREKFSGSLISFLQKEKLLTPHTVLVHGIHLNTEELKIVAQCGSWLCVCPLNNVFIKEPIHDIDYLLRLGVKVCLGSDSVTLTGTNSIIANARYMLETKNIDANVLQSIIFENNYKLIKDSCNVFTDYFCVWENISEEVSSDFILEDKKLLFVFDSKFNIYSADDFMG